MKTRFSFLSGKSAVLAVSLLAASLSTATASLPAPTGFAFAKGAKFTVAGYSGSTPLTGFPVLVRLAENSPVGFSYADLSSASGADLCFVDMDGNGLPFEIDTWNASGESLIWVRLPSITNGTEFVMCWGGGMNGKAVCNDSPFSDYVGVWHMSEASGTVADSSGHGLTATPTGADASTKSVAVSGPVGNGRQCSDSASARSYLIAPSYNSQNVGNTFAVSGWFNVGSGQTADARVFSRKANYTDNNGWEVVWKNNNKFSTRGASSSALAEYSTAYGQGWKHFFIVYDNKTSTIYENGVQKAQKTNGTAATDNDRPLGIGGYGVDNNESQFVGIVDECRLLDAVPSVDWVKAEYDSMNDAAFLTAGEAESYGALVDLSAGISVSDISYTNATIGVSVGALGSGAASASVLVQLAATSDFASPVWSTTYSVTEPGLQTFPVAGLATNAAYFARAFVTNNLDDAVAAGPFPFQTLSPGAPVASAAVSGRTASSISTSVSVTTFGAGSDACSARLEVSTDGFATVASFAETVFATPDSVEMEVPGLSPFTVYALRLRVTNSWGVTTLVDLGIASTLPASGLSELYVDSLGTGNGSSPESALPTIRAALDIAGPDWTIWVRGGDGRAYGVSSNADAISIPAALEGLSIRAYSATPGDGGRAALSVSNSYVEDGGSAHIVSIEAPDVTFAGFICSYGPRSLGYQNSPTSVKFVAVAAPRFTLSECEFFCTGVPGFSGSGDNGIVAALQVGNDYHAAAGMTIERCFFHDTVGYRRDVAYAPLLVANDTTVRECVFTNTMGIARDPGPEKTKFRNFTFVSNVVCAHASGGNYTVSFAEKYGSLFASGYGGLGPGAEVAYNVFIGSGDANRGILAFTRNDGFGGVQSVHHNVVKNFAWIWGFNRGSTAPTQQTVAQFFDNVVELSEDGSVVRDEGFSGGNPIVGRSLFVANSFSRRNAILAPAAFWGGASALAEGYDRSVVSPLDDIAITASPDWIHTDNIFHEDFYRYKSVHGEGDLGRLGWAGQNNEYPTYIGALPPLYPEETLIILR